MRQKFKVCCAFVLMLLSCIACNKAENMNVNSWSDSKPESNLKMSAELLTEDKIDMESPIEIKVGFGRACLYTAATFEIFATGFQIIDPEGNTYQDEYTVMYDDFSDEKYGFITEGSDFVGLKYFETFQFKYEGEGDVTKGGISFRITTLQHGEPATEEEIKRGGVAGAGVAIYYTIEDEEMTLTTKWP